MWKFVIIVCWFCKLVNMINVKKIWKKFWVYMIFFLLNIGNGFVEFNV